MSSFTLNINKKEYPIDCDPKMPLLWVLRDLLDLTGTKYGCGIGQCGACTVIMEGEAKQACLVPVESVGDQKITTIEGLAENDRLHPVQQAWVEEDVAQCGYCQAGQIVRAVLLLQENPDPNNEEIHKVMSGNICRCGTYQRIRKGIKRAVENI